MTLSANIRPHLDWTYYTTNAFGVQVQDRTSYVDGDFTLSDGTGDAQANKLYTATRTITGASTADALDLAGGLTDIFGNTLTFTSIKAILIQNMNTTSGDDLTVGGGTNPITSLWNGSTTAKARIKAGGCWFMSSRYDGFAITAGTADILTVEHHGATSQLTYDIMIIGVG